MEQESELCSQLGVGGLRDDYRSDLEGKVVLGRLCLSYFNVYFPIIKYMDLLVKKSTIVALSAQIPSLGIALASRGAST